MYKIFNEKTLVKESVKIQDAVNATHSVCGIDKRSICWLLLSVEDYLPDEVALRSKENGSVVRSETDGEDVLVFVTNTVI